ncbi:ion channel [Nocardioides sp. P5_C9_2]
MARRVLVPRTYRVVLALVAITFVVSSSAGAQGQPVGVLLQVATAWFALVTARAQRPTRLLVVPLLAATAITALVATLASSPTVVLAAGTLLYVFVPVAILRHLALRPQVDRETLWGAVASYAMIGMVYGFCYQLTGVVQAGPFFGSEGDPTTAQALFFSFTTLTTTGYGNLVPASNPGQSLAVSEMFLGQLFLVTIVAKVMSALGPRRRPSDESSVREGEEGAG